MRTILHCDINNCFASIEMAMTPSLRGHAIAVCGDPALRRGIVLAKSEEAKKYGVKTGDTLWLARKKCPNIQFVLPHFEVYEEYSRQIRRYYGQWTPLVEPFGLDECWLDVTGIPFLHEHSALELAHRIRLEICRIFQVTISVGVSFNKVFAKLGSDLKKPNAVTEITASGFRRQIWPLSVENLLWVGAATREKLKRLGIYTIGMLAQADRGWIHAQFGKNGDVIWLGANGLDEAPVAPECAVRKTLGHGTTLVSDAWSISEVWPVICTLAEKTAFELQEENMVAYGMQVYVRFTDLRFKQFQRQFESAVSAARMIADYALMMIDQSDVMHDGVRAIGIRMTALRKADEPHQLSLFSRDLERKNALEMRTDSVMRDIRAKFGKQSILRGNAEMIVQWCHPPGGNRK